MLETFSSKETDQKSLLSIRARTSEEELKYIEWIISQRETLQQYNPVLPVDEHFTAAWQTGTYDIEELQSKMKMLYDASHYSPGLEKLEECKVIVENQVLPILKQWQHQWGFKVYPNYEILLTQYGTGGSYHPDTGLINMFVRNDGTFKRNNPLHTVVHEIVHLGIEETIIKKFGLNHWQKERLVDLICSVAFGNILVDYKEQAKGDTSIDAYITTESLNNLPLAIDQFATASPTPSRSKN